MSDVVEPAISDIKDIFICDCEENMRSACRGEVFFGEHEGKNYCVLHYPGKDKNESFRSSLMRKLDAHDFDFNGVWFPEDIDFTDYYFIAKTCFRKAIFSAAARFWKAKFEADADFRAATFNADTDFDEATFRADVSFREATFRADVSFREATFRAATHFWKARFGADADFCEATFRSDVSFREATFRAATHFWKARFETDADFCEATFLSNVYFLKAKFDAAADFSAVTFNAHADFSAAIFNSYVRFASSQDSRSFGKTTKLVFHLARIEKPEYSSFHTLYLHPYWFINVDCRNFEFIDVDWGLNLKEELKSAIESGIGAPHIMLSIAYRQLADNAEANHRYHEASRFRYNAFELQRIERFNGFVPWRLDWWYWLASGYGERVGQAFLVFAALIALFACGYSKVGFKQEIEGATGRPAISQQRDIIGKPLEWKEALVYSAYVSILQKPEPKPLTFAAYSLVWAETILGPAQAALLALAIRRRFMR